MPLGASGLVGRRLAMFGDDGFEGAERCEEGALELADLAAVGRQIAFARERDRLFLDLGLVKGGAGGAALEVDAGSGEERDIDAEAGEPLQVEIRGEGCG